jgi:hypothetical protein
LTDARGRCYVLDAPTLLSVSFRFRISHRTKRIWDPEIDRMKTAIFAASVVVWLIITSVSAYAYALHRVTSPEAAPGYETTWDFQLLMFAISRLPVFVAALIVVLWLERRFLPKSD